MPIGSLFATPQDIVPSAPVRSMTSSPDYGTTLPAPATASSPNWGNRLTRLGLALQSMSTLPDRRAAAAQQIQQLRQEQMRQQEQQQQARQLALSMKMKILQSLGPNVPRETRMGLAQNIASELQALGGGSVDPNALAAGLQPPNKLMTVAPGGTVIDQTGKQIFAAPAADKAPPGYQLNSDGSMSYIPGGPADPKMAASLANARNVAPAATTPTGYRQNKDGSLSYIPGGPADPKQVTDLMKAKSDAGNLEPTPEEIGYWSDVVRKGGSMPPGLARTAAGSRLVQQVMKYMASGDTSPSEFMANQAEYKGVQAGQRTVGQRTATIEMAGTEAYKMADLALTASKNFPRTGFVPFNKAYQAYQSGTGDPNISKFVAATNSLINAYARAIAPTGVPTVADKEHARLMINTAQTQKQYAAVIDQLKLEIEAAKQAPQTTRKEFTTVVKGIGEKPQAPITATKKTPSGPIDFNSLPK